MLNDTSMILQIISFRFACIHRKPVQKRSDRIKKKITVVDFSPKRSRGRPPKSEPTKLSSDELKRLSSRERQYYEMRFRNNEASRRARCKRNVEKKALFKEVLELEAINKELILKDIKLDKKLKIWKEKIIKLVGNKKMSKLVFREIQGDLFSAPKT